MTERLGVGQLAGIACVLEASAPKPGNVHRFRDFDDTHYLDFILSAHAIGPALDRASHVGIGVAILDAVRATRQVVASNTNLGMILLLAPLAAAASHDRPLREAVETTLEATTIQDARLVFEAIRLARPGGLGRVAEEDVADEPTRPLRAIMALGSDRDAVARQYANGFADVFDLALPRLVAEREAGRSLETAIVAAHLALMTELPDTLIARKCGNRVAEESARRARAVLDAGWPNSADGRRRCESLDRWLRLDGHARNPGASADLVTAALFAALLDGTIPLPLRPSDWTQARNRAPRRER